MDAQTSNTAEFWWIPWLPLLGVLIGGILTIASNLCVSWWSDRLRRIRERQQVASAISAELKGLLSLFERRKIIDLLQANLKTTKAKNELFYYRFPISENYREVFENNLQFISSLPPSLAADVIEVYSYIKGCIEDFKILESGDLDNWELSEATSFLDDVIDMLKITREKVTKLIPSLEIQAYSHDRGR